MYDLYWIKFSLVFAEEKQGVLEKAYLLCFTSSQDKNNEGVILCIYGITKNYNSM